MSHMRLVFTDDDVVELDSLTHEGATTVLQRAYPWPADRLWVRANMVVTVDGRAQAANGLTEAISSPEDKVVFGHLRADCDAVLVGAGTVRAEGYHALRPKPAWREARIAGGRTPAPALAIVSQSLEFDLTSDPFSAPDDNPEISRPLIITTHRSPAERRRRLERVADVIVCGDDRLDVDQLLHALGERGLLRVLCEGGPRLLADLLSADAIDELDLTLSPLVLMSPVGSLLGIDSAASPQRLKLAHVLQAESTLMLRYLVDRGVFPKE